MSDEYSPPGSGRWTAWLAAVLAAALVLSAVPAVQHLRERPAPAPPPVRAAWAPPAGLTVGAGTEYPFGLALAPDGRRLVFPAAHEGRVQLWLQHLSTGETTPLPGTDGAALPFWSPDGARIGFFAGGALRRFDLDTARVTDLTRVEVPRGATWNARGDLVLAGDAGLVHIAPDGGMRALTTVDRGARESAHLFPMFFEDGTRLVCLIRADDIARQGLYVVSLADGSRTRVAGSAASAVPVGRRLIFASDGALVSQTLDTATGRLAGRATVIGVRVGHSTSGHLLATAAADTLLFSEPVTLLHELVWMSRTGERLGQVGPPADTWSARVAPDGRRVAATVLDPLLRTLDIELWEPGVLASRRVSLSIDADEWPAWSPDGLRLAWVSGGRTLTVRGAGAVLPAETLARFDEALRVSDWTPDGSAVLVTRARPDRRDDIWLVPLKGEPRPLVSTPFADVGATISPDGRWVAYASDESGRFEVYVERLRDRAPEPGTRERVTSGGGSDPRWSRDGQELFFRRGSAIHAATPALGRGQHAVAATSMLFDTKAPVRTFDVARDGRFLVCVPATSPPAPVTLVVGAR